MTCLVIGSVAFGFMAWFKSLAMGPDQPGGGANTATILALRFLLGAVGLWAIVLVRRAVLPKGRTLAMLIAMGGVCYFIEAVGYFHGLEFATSGTIALLLYTYPAMVALASRLVFAEHLDRRKILALVLALLGTSITIGVELSGSWAGISLGLACAAGYAVYVLAGAKLLPQTLDPLASSTIVVSSAACSLTMYALLMGWQPPTSPTGWLGVGGLALVCTVLAITAILAGLARVGPVRASTISTIEPLATVVIGATLLREPIGLAQVLGGALIILGAIIAAQPSNALAQA
jgi:drug/metabolite transporter (DMT)-like permease